MALEIVSEACGFQEHFNISGPAVTDDKKRETAGKNLQCFLKIRIQRSTFAKKCFVLCPQQPSMIRSCSASGSSGKELLRYPAAAGQKPHQSFGAYIGIHVLRMDKVITCASATIPVESQSVPSTSKIILSIRKTSPKTMICKNATLCTGHSTKTSYCSFNSQ